MYAVYGTMFSEAEENKRRTSASTAHAQLVYIILYETHPLLPRSRAVYGYSFHLRKYPNATQRRRGYNRSCSIIIHVAAAKTSFLLSLALSPSLALCCYGQGNGVHAGRLPALPQGQGAVAGQGRGIQGGVTDGRA